MRAFNLIWIYETRHLGLTSWTHDKVMQMWIRNLLMSGTRKEPKRFTNSRCVRLDCYVGFVMHFAFLGFSSLNFSLIYLRCFCEYHFLESFTGTKKSKSIPLNLNKSLMKMGKKSFEPGRTRPFRCLDALATKLSQARPVAGVEPAPFRSPVGCCHHWAITANSWSWQNHYLSVVSFSF